MSVVSRQRKHPVTVFEAQLRCVGAAAPCVQCRGSGGSHTAAGATLPAESILARHLATASALDPAARAAALEANVEFQSVHKAMASEGQSAMAQSQSDVRHHLRAFVPVGGTPVAVARPTPGPPLAAAAQAAVAAGARAAAAGESSTRAPGGRATPSPHRQRPALVGFRGQR